MNRPRKNSRRGSTLAVTVMMFLVLTILAVGVIGVSFADHQLVIAEERTTQAYYTARSVVNGTFEWLKKNTSNTVAYNANVPTALGFTNVRESQGTLDGMDYHLYIWRDESVTYQVHIRATAVNQGFQSKAELTYTAYGVGLFDDTIYSKEDIEVSGNANQAIGGNVRSEHDIGRKLNVVGGVPIPDSPEIDFPPVTPVGVVFTAANTFSGSRTWTSGTTISQNTRYTGTLTASGSVTINNVNDIHIWIEDMVYNDLTITTTGGQGRVFIYVDEDFDASGSKSKIDIGNSDGIPYVYLTLNSENEVTLRGNNILLAYMYAPSSHVDFGGCPGLSGAIVCGVFAMNGNVSITKVEPNLAGSPFEPVSNAMAGGMTASKTWLP